MLEYLIELLHHPYTAAFLGLLVGYFILRDVVRAIASMVFSFYRSHLRRQRQSSSQAPHGQH